MIIETHYRRCTKCDSPKIVKNGHDYKGAQKFHCHACKAMVRSTGNVQMTHKPVVKCSTPILKGSVCGVSTAFSRFPATPWRAGC